MVRTENHRSATRSARSRKRNDAGRRPLRSRATLGDRFREVSDSITGALGTPWALVAAAGIIVVWAMTGPIFHFSDTWQLVINTATTIVTFLMVFVIQTSQNRQAKATQFKLDELIRSIPGARNRMIAAERETSEELQRQEEEFQRAAERGGRDDPLPAERPAPHTSRRRRRA